jgi:nucleotide-binding universal stress UspA family protein
VVCVFARKTSEPLASLVKQIDSKIGENGKLKSFVVILSRDAEKSAADLRKLASDAGVKHVPLTVHGDPAEVPDYELSRSADVTVVMWSRHKVKAARGYKGELSEDNIREILSDVPKVLGD